MFYPIPAVLFYTLLGTTADKATTTPTVGAALENPASPPPGPYPYLDVTKVEIKKTKCKEEVEKDRPADVSVFSILEKVVGAIAILLWIIYIGWVGGIFRKKCGPLTQRIKRKKMDAEDEEDEELLVEKPIKEMQAQVGLARQRLFTWSNANGPTEGEDLTEVPENYGKPVKGNKGDRKSSLFGGLKLNLGPFSSGGSDTHVGSNTKVVQISDANDEEYSEWGEDDGWGETKV